MTLLKHEENILFSLYNLIDADPTKFNFLFKDYIKQTTIQITLENGGTLGISKRIYGALGDDDVKELTKFKSQAEFDDFKVKIENFLKQKSLPALDRAFIINTFNKCNSESSADAENIRMPQHEEDILFCLANITHADTQKINYLFNDSLKNARWEIKLDNGNSIVVSKQIIDELNTYHHEFNLNKFESQDGFNNFINKVRTCINELHSHKLKKENIIALYSKCNTDPSKQEVEVPSLGASQSRFFKKNDLVPDSETKQQENELHNKK